MVKMAGVTMVGVKGGVYTRRCFETEGVACLTEQAGGAGWSGVRGEEEEFSWEGMDEAREVHSVS